ncbi:MAG TPA: type II toxin-antitoxin system PemK/MazF family toxin [Gammaproteobacteria bacterium]|nr:type II toxin-antitoxin system PemK/MazF family toxin [Gammaproteobacteria bacterium]
MTKHRVPQKGDVYIINPNPQAGREMRNPHRFIVISPKEINKLGTAITVPVTSGGNYSRLKGLTVSISGYDTTGVAVCNQVRSFDIEERVRIGTAKYIENLGGHIIDEIVLKVISVIDPAQP